LVDRLLRCGGRSVLEVGCGAGQLACFLRDCGITQYIGVDFSKVAIGYAKKACPEFMFNCSDIYESDVLRSWDYDVFISTEFLEHVPWDTELLRRLRPGVKVYSTVPNFGGCNHLRYFRDCDEVRQRYGSIFHDFEVTALLANRNGKTYYLFQGTKPEDVSD
jgi:2-polyprenyl-3-methyl-5-hydroxy-6-metoxy-1,4-benzoquinol methylase